MKIFRYPRRKWKFWLPTGDPNWPPDVKDDRTHDDNYRTKDEYDDKGTDDDDDRTDDDDGNRTDDDDDDWTDDDDHWIMMRMPIREMMMKKIRGMMIMITTRRMMRTTIGQMIIIQGVLFDWASPENVSRLPPPLNLLRLARPKFARCWNHIHFARHLVVFRSQGRASLGL